MTVSLFRLETKIIPLLFAAVGDLLVILQPPRNNIQTTRKG